MASRTRQIDGVQAVRNAIKFMGESLNDACVVGDVECGLHSGLPLCCIVFFVKVRWRLDEAGVASYRQIRGDHKANYFACPRCLIEQTIVEMHPCDCSAKCDGHLRRELQKLATRKRRPKKWVDMILQRYECEEPLDAETQAAIDRGHTARDAETVARYAPQKRTPTSTPKRHPSRTN